MEENKRPYMTIEERKKQRKQLAKQRALEEKLNKKKEKQMEKERKKQDRPAKLKRRLVFLILLITLFLVSFSTTAYILINANNLVSGDAVTELKKELEEKNRIIEDLTIKTQK